MYIQLCSNDKEWQAAKDFRQRYFFDKCSIQDPYHWTFTHKDHKHLILYVDNMIAGYIHIQLWLDQRAAIRIMVIEESLQRKGYGTFFMQRIEHWLNTYNYRSLHIESSPSALAFYQTLGYDTMDFDDPDGYESSKEDIALGKLLS